MFLILTTCWLVAILPSISCEQTTSEFSNPYDLDGPCQEHIQKLARVQSAMTECATNFSSPPKVCTNCIDQYIKFKEMEYSTHHLVCFLIMWNSSTNVTSLDNRTCSSIFYESYALSYGAEISNSLTQKIWDSSRCGSCLIINWQLEHQNSTIEYDKKTIEFEKTLLKWRSCVSNFTSHEEEEPKNSTICKKCGKEFDALFGYYWKIYKEPGIDFCLDVETTMNDTMSIWHAVWMCPDDDKPDVKHFDMTIVAFSASFLTVIICLFYMGSYIQIEHSHRNYVRYSRIQAPRGTRSRLLSSSTVDDSMFTPNSSQHG
ncbi:hypothetical protein M3Y95_00556300 [Aphelenchoides besseyi]|nr:hypothetical protein M3Y95_00556300 [Aphelenchoides besseyi]